ncbi:hypothetical protein Q7W10_05155 [Streptococcus suis]|nr:hypothetical protein [Streptococcus suis]MDW8720363.1 hypothetical protein [Streptococcus suis]
MLEPVPLTVPQYCHFEKKGRNDILMKIRLGKVEVTFFHSINQETFQQLQTLRLQHKLTDHSKKFVLLQLSYKRGDDLL